MTIMSRLWPESTSEPDRMAVITALGIFWHWTMSAQRCLDGDRPARRECHHSNLYG